MKPISPSQIAVLAAGLTPIGLVNAKQAGLCVMCGVAHDVGESVVPFVPPDTFTDYASLRNPGGTHMCSWCNAAWRNEFSQKYLKTVICERGVFSAASNDNIAYWLLNPPDGEWLFLQGDQKVQHLAFRAPINRSKAVYQIQKGDLIVTIRKAMLVAGAEAAKSLANVATQIRGRTDKRAAPVKSPFVSLSRDFDSLSQGLIKNELLTEAKCNPQVAQWIQTIGSLTAGELWGLTAVLYAKNDNVNPEPQPKLTH